MRRAHTHEHVRTYTRELIKKVKFVTDTFKLEQSYAHAIACTYRHARTHARTNAHTPAHAHASTHARTHARMYAHERTHAHTHPNVQAPKYEYTFEHARERTNSHTHTHTPSPPPHTHTQTYTLERSHAHAFTSRCKRAHKKHHTWIKPCDAELPPTAATTAYRQHRLPCRHCQMASLMATITHSLTQSRPPARPAARTHPCTRL